MAGSGTPRPGKGRQGGARWGQAREGDMGEERTPKFDQDAGAQAVVIGRIVHYVPNAGETYSGSERPAIIVQVWQNPGQVSLLVFLDGTNDQAYRGAPDNSPTF